LKAQAQFPFDVVGTELTAFGKDADIVDIGRALCNPLVRQVQDRLEIAVPCDKARVGAEHDDAIAHIVEGDAQLGLAVAQFFEQARILDRDHRLVRESGSEFNLLVREGFDARAVNRKYADQDLLA